MTAKEPTNITIQQHEDSEAPISILRIANMKGEEIKVSDLYLYATVFIPAEIDNDHVAKRTMGEQIGMMFDPFDETPFAHFMAAHSNSSESATLDIVSFHHQTTDRYEAADKASSILYGMASILNKAKLG